MTSVPSGSRLYTDIHRLATMAPLVKGTPARRLHAEDLGVIMDGAMLVSSEGTLLWAGEKSSAPSVPPSQVVSLNAELVLPGFVDCHTHLVFAGEREAEFRARAAGKTYQEIASMGGGILTSVRATRAATLDELIDIGRQRLKIAASFGVSTIEAKSGYGLSDDGERKTLQALTRLKHESPFVLVRTHLGAHAFPQDMSREDYMDLVEDSIPRWHKENLFDHVDMFIEENYYTVEDGKRIIDQAKRHKIPFKIHADEFANVGASQLGLEHGALSLDHLLHYLDVESEAVVVDRFRRAGSVAVFLPGAALSLKLPYANAMPLLKNGVPVALATDFNPGSSMTQNITLMMTLAVLYMGFHVEEAVAASTIQGARALGLKNVGHLTAGARADFQVYDVPYGHIVYEFGRPLIRGLYLAGESFNFKSSSI
jgi:imidazolonepropionase